MKHWLSSACTFFVLTVIGVSPVAGLPAAPPLCTTFDDGTVGGFTATNATLTTAAPGFSGAPGDQYLSAADGANASLIFAPASYHGDYLDFFPDRCGELCFDMQVVNDGFPGVVPKTLTFNLISDPDGPGPQPPIRFLFRASRALTEPAGPNPGWDRFCAPIHPLVNGQLPSGPDGMWIAPQGTDVNTWNTVLSNVTTLSSQIDINGAGFETIGYDNICLFAADDCAEPGTPPPTVNVPWDHYVCPEEGGVTTPEVTVCNKSGADQDYTFAFRPLQAGEHPACHVDGPTSLTALNPPMPFTIEPGDCRKLEVQAVLPAGLGPGRDACWEAEVTEVGTGHIVSDFGTFPTSNGLCCRTRKPAVVVPPRGSTATFDVTAAQSRPFDYTVTAFAPGMVPDDGVLVLNGGEPGEPVTGSTTLEAGVTETIDVDVAVTPGTTPPDTFYDLLLKADLDGDGTLDPVSSVSLLPTASPCVEGLHELCLNGDRFQVEVFWTDFQGGTGVGRAVPLTDDTGYFWFFSANNVELVLKVLDGRAVNDFYWVFYGALSNVEYTVRVTDLLTGASKDYENPAGRFASVGDTRAFAAAPQVAAGSDAPTAGPEVAPPFAVDRDTFAAAPVIDEGLTRSCAPTGERLCLTEDRFEVTVEWTDFQGNSGVGRAVPITDDTGYFWFFAEENVELVVKVLDARVINDHFWVFYGALSNVEYRLTVTDTATGVSKTYDNPSGNFGSVGDTRAF